MSRCLIVADDKPYWNVTSKLFSGSTETVGSILLRFMRLSKKWLQGRSNRDCYDYYFKLGPHWNVGTVCGTHSPP